MNKRKVILVTDGDMVAKAAVETAARNVGARCISASAGNPTPISGEAIVGLIKKTPHDPVVVMLDDKGCRGQGKGERALSVVANHPDIEVLGVLAVAANCGPSQRVPLKQSIDADGEFVEVPVDKLGRPEQRGHKYLEGDTVTVLPELDITVMLGIGDIGKMNGADDPDSGAPVTTRALQFILEKSGFERNTINDW